MSEDNEEDSEEYEVNRNEMKVFLTIQSVFT